MNHPCIIQGGMGAGVSNWELAQAVSRTGQLGVVSGTALDQILARRLQLGDPEGHMRRALKHFPVPAVAQRVLEKYFIPGGKAETRAFTPVPMYTIDPGKELLELTVAANFVEVFLAREGHDGLIGINYLEKIQMPTLPSLYGAMLAGVDYVLMGAGIPREIPGALDLLSEHREASLKLNLENPDRDDDLRLRFDPDSVIDADLPPLQRPLFLAIIASTTLAMALLKRATGKIDGFIIEAATAGGHNAPPRGSMQLSDQGEPIYGPRDEVDLTKIRELGLPFWVAGFCADPLKLEQILEMGGTGIQVGTLFAFCQESGLDDDVKDALLEQIRTGQAEVFTDPVASPTGFPFKVVRLDGSLSEEETYDERPRVCNLGYLRSVYKKEEGKLEYRCAAEPVAAYLKKDGEREGTTGRKCLCNGLMANIGLPQVRPKGYVEKPLVTAGDDIDRVRLFLQDDRASYTAEEVVQYLLEAVATRDADELSLAQNSLSLVKK